MNAIKRNKSNIDFIFLLTLFAAFLICALFIVLFGAKIYQKTVSDMDQNFTRRTVSAYISEKIKQNDTANCVYEDTADGVSLLRLDQVTEYGTYSTYLYYADGYLREITQNADAEFHKEDGTQVIALADFTVHQEGSLFTFTATDTNSERFQFCVATRTVSGVTPPNQKKEDVYE